MRTSALALLLMAIPFISCICHASELRVKGVQGKSAILEEVRSGMIFQVKEGQEIGNGWKVYEIEDDLVTIEKETEPGILIRGQMPVHSDGKFETSQ